MKVGLIAPVWCSVPPVGYGGTETVVDALARGLRSLGHEVVLAASGDSTCPVEVRSTVPRQVGRMEEIGPELVHVLCAYDALRDCDVVHDHTTSGLLVAASRPDLPPVVTTSHGPIAGATRDLYARVADRVAVIAISHSQAAAAPELVRAVVHHGVVPEDHPVGDGAGGYLLFLGRMSPGKGAHRAARVARAAGVPLLIAAKMRETAEHEYFRREVEPLLGDGVEFVGEVAGDDKHRLLCGARALLMPIRWPEPFGMVMVEALACGTPVLAFPEGSAPEVVEHGRTGFLCADEAAMATAVDRVDELSRAECRRAVEQRFSADRLARDHLAVYRWVSQQRRPRLARAVHELQTLRRPRHLHRTRVVDLDVQAAPAQRDASYAQ